MARLGDIDITKKPVKPKLFLAKPNGTIIAKLSEAYNINTKVRLGSINELRFDLPLHVERNHELVRNEHWDMIRERYLIKLVVGNAQEWYMITSLGKQMDEDADYRTVEAKSLAIELADKRIEKYDVTSKRCSEVLHDALSKTIWSVGYVDAMFDTKYRSFKVDSKTVLDFIFEVAETFGALVEFDTDKRQVLFKDPNKVGQDRGLRISYGKYLKTLSQESRAEEIVTRLVAYGKDDLTFREVNPTGTHYIEDFSYFMYPFQRDPVTKKVIQHSYYMSDSLCHALLDYNEKVAARAGEFKNYIDQKKALVEQMNQLQLEWLDLQFNLAQAEDNKDVQQAQGTYNEVHFTHSGGTTSKSVKLAKNKKHAVFAWVENVSGVTVRYNGSTVSIPSGTWKLIAKENVGSSAKTVSLSISGTPSYVIDVKFVTVSITDSEYNTPGNETGLILRYVVEYNRELAEAKQAEIDDINDELVAIDANIRALRDDLAVENNFTPEQIKELNMFIIEKEWRDNNYIDPQDLYEAAKKMLEEMNKPQMILNINIVNFLEIVEAQHDWDKLVLGDYVTIKHERFGINVKARIIEVDTDYEDGEISITIANIKDIEDDQRKLLKLLYKSVSSSTTVDMSRFKWDGLVDEVNTINTVINNVWEAAKREIVAGVNESVIIDRRGITIKDPTDPNRFLRATHGVLGITNDGGATFKHAITAEGIVGERIYGQIIIGQNLTIGDENGIINMVGDLLTIKDNQGKTRVELGQYDAGKYGLRVTSKNGDKIVLDEDGILQTWQVGNEDNLDNEHPIVLKIYFPPETKEIRKVLLNFTLEKFRTYSKSAADWGGTTVTSASARLTGVGYTDYSGEYERDDITYSFGGYWDTTSEATWWASSASESVLNYSGGHSHSFTTGAAGVHNHGIPAGTRIAVTDGSSIIGYYTWVESGSHTHSGSTSYDGIHTHSITAEHTHDYYIPTHFHWYTIYVPNHVHYVFLDLPSHWHEVEIPGHNHALVYGIYESTTPANVRVIINGIDRTSALGGGSGFNTDVLHLDITQYMNIGLNTIQLTSSRLGRINAWAFIQAFMSSS